MEKKLFILLLLVIHSYVGLGQIDVKFPPERMVFQRDQNGNAVVFINGNYTSSVDEIQARLKSRSGEPGNAVDWTTISSSQSGGVFSGSLNATGGRYDLEVRGMKNGQQVGNSSTVDKVGVGEVFLIVGHSNASWGDSPMVGANSDMVNSIDTRKDDNLYDDYLEFGTADYMPPLKPSQLCLNCGMAPMARDPWLWSRLGDLLVQPSALNVPVLFYSAAFGGSNMNHMYKSAYNIPFDHGFIKYSIRMPYCNVRNTLQAYMPRTGLRGILSMHGVNDRDTTADGFKFRNLMVIEKTREESNYPKLPWLIATSCYINGIVQEVTNGQEALIAEVPDVFRGANLNAIGNEGRYDNLHFNEYGQIRAAELWRDAIIDPATNILQNAQPFMAQSPPLPGPPLPVTLIEFKGEKVENGKNELKWVTSSEEENDYFEIQKSGDAISFKTIGNIKGVGNSSEENTYTFTDESPETKMAYYRLKQVDFDGTSTLSRIVAVGSGIDDSKGFVFPNPAEHYIEISTINGAVVAEMVLFDQGGNVVSRNSHQSQMDISKIAQGDYMIQVKMGSGEVVRKKIVKL